MFIQFHHQLSRFGCQVPLSPARSQQLSVQPTLPPSQGHSHCPTHRTAAVHHLYRLQAFRFIAYLKVFVNSSPSGGEHSLIIMASCTGPLLRTHLHVRSWIFPPLLKVGPTSCPLSLLLGSLHSPTLPVSFWAPERTLQHRSNLFSLPFSLLGKPTPPSHPFFNLFCP